MTVTERTGSGTPDEEYAALSIEQRGIDYITDENRHMTVTQLALMWSGGLTTVGTLVYGLTIMSLGLSFAQASLIIVVGNLSFLLLAFGSLQGPRAGTSAMTVTRAVFGRNGARPIAFFNWLNVLGYETLGIALSVIAGTVLMQKAGFTAGTPAKIILTVVAAALLLILPVFGHAMISKALRFLLVPFIALFVIFAILSLGKTNLHAVHHGAGWGTMMVALAISISAGGLGWANQASDYSRYLPRTASTREIMVKVTIGCYVPQTVLMFVGALVGTVVTSGTNPFTDLPKAFASWFLIPYLIVALVQNLGETTLDLYSSGLSLQTLGIMWHRARLVTLDLVLAGLMALGIEFSSSFYNDLNDFVLFGIVWLAPWFGIFAVDFFLRRGTYDGPNLVDGENPALAGTKQIRVQALVAQVVGMGAAVLWLNAYPAYVSPLSNHFDGSDFSIFMGTGVAGLIYFILARKQVPKEIVGTRTAEAIAMSEKEAGTAAETGTTGLVLD